VAVPDGAWGEAAAQGGDARVEARLLVHPDRDPDGALRLGLLLDLDPGWHVYWRNPGDSGLATELQFRLEGAQVGPIAWPAPAAFREMDGRLTTYGYTDQVLLSAAARPRPGQPLPRRAGVEARLLICRLECIPARIELWRDLAAGSTDPEGERALFRRYAEREPSEPASLGIALEASTSRDALRPGDGLRGALTVRSCAGRERGDGCQRYTPADQDVVFFPDALEGFELVAIGIDSRPEDDRSFLLTFEARSSGEDPGLEPRLRGVLALRGPSGERRYLEVDVPLPPAAAEARALPVPVPPRDPAPASLPASGWLRAIVLALAGGLILNLMPCVLPILAIKVCAVAEMAHRDRRTVLIHGLAYGAGVVLSMAALACVVVVLRWAGTAVGWGFQFQEPLFVAGICAVLVVFALNLFAVFEFRIDTGRLSQLGLEGSEARRSFFEGLLAVVLATPCSAPFLGTAVGFAFAGSAALVFAVFAAIGVGLAAPFVLITLVPGWARVVPRSGPWMLQLRAGLGFALLATVVWLLWVAGRSAGVEAMAALLGFLVIIAFATWLYGQVQATGRTRLTAAVAVGLLGIVVAGLDTVSLARDDGGDGAADPGTLAFDPTALEAAVGDGRPAFVYFTADWCITCKVNERVVISDPRVQAELALLDVAVFRGDWTQRDETIRAALARFGKAGVPLYLVYAPADLGSPAVLPELLSVQGMLEALREAAGRSHGA
jgi:thiol:disulfide interchange protein DsbD